VVQSVDFATFLGGNPAYADPNQQTTSPSDPNVIKIVDKNGQVFEIPADIDLGVLGPLGAATGSGLNFATGLQSRAQDIDLATFLGGGGGGGGEIKQPVEAPMVDLDNLPDWINPPDPNKAYPMVLSTVTNPHTGETVTVPHPGYTYNDSYTPPDNTGATPTVPPNTGDVVQDTGYYGKGSDVVGGSLYNPSQRDGLRGQGRDNTGGAPYRGIDFATFLGNNPADTPPTDAAPAPPPVPRDIVVPSAMPPTSPNTFSNPYVTTPPAGAETTFMNLLGTIPNAPPPPNALPPPNPYVSTAQGIASLAKPDGSI
tara:strand:+ start:2839 stop:3774 length:936 start_codon:yes stop_codon:yes gene_type:complete